MIGILADVHGNAPALESVLRELDKAGCDSIISLGDICGYCCQVNECIDLIRERNALNIMGNHDHYIVTHTACPRSRSANTLLAYQRKVIRRGNMEWLAKSAARLEFQDASFVHGGWLDSLDEYVSNPDETYFSALPFRYFFSGHTHIQSFHRMKEICHCNPGSVGQPRDRDPRAAFATFDGTTTKLHRIEYDIDAIAFAMNRCGFDAYYYRGLYTGERIGIRESRTIETP